MVAAWCRPRLRANASRRELAVGRYDGSVRGEIVSSPREDNARATRRKYQLSAVGFTLRYRFTKAHMAS